jgi:tetratricopeptide (TPR) repeat protein
MQHGSGDTCSRLTDDEADLMPGGLDTISNGISSPNQRRNSNGSNKSSTAEGRPRRYRRRTIDTTDSSAIPAKILTPLVKTASSVLASSRHILQRQGSVARRNTLDSLVSSHTRRGSNGSVISVPREVEEESYNSKQARLQKLADAFHKCGELDSAILIWMELLDLAEENRESLSNKTEIMCILIDLHFHQSQRPPSLEEDCYDSKWEENKVEECPTEEPLDAKRDRMISMSASQSTSSRSFAIEEELPSSPEYHSSMARRYVHRIKPTMVKSAWIGSSLPFMEFLIEAEAWELALVAAEKLMKEPGIPQVNAGQLATLHFQIASLKLDSQRHGEALLHLQATVKNLQKFPTKERDMVMYIQVLQLLAAEYLQQGQPALAIETYKEQQIHTPPDKQAHICCQMAEIYISERQLDKALVELDLAAQMLDGDDQSSNSTVRLQLLQTKGDVYYRLGRMDESMEVYQQALQEAQNPADKAKLFYTMGRLCIRLRRTREAISFFSRELDITQQELGVNHLSVSRIYHELAKLYDEGLGEHKMALMKYNKALQIELAVLQECHYSVSICQRCNPVAHRMCDIHAHHHTQVTGQIRETKKCQGRMHFKLGDFDKALKTSFNEQTSRSSNNHGGRMINTRNQIVR